MRKHKQLSKAGKHFLDNKGSRMGSRHKIEPIGNNRTDAGPTGRNFHFGGRKFAQHPRMEHTNRFVSCQGVPFCRSWLCDKGMFYLIRCVFGWTGKKTPLPVAGVFHENILWKMFSASFVFEPCWVGFLLRLESCVFGGFFKRGFISPCIESWSLKTKIKIKTC